MRSGVPLLFGVKQFLGAYIHSEAHRNALRSSFSEAYTLRGEKVDRLNPTNCTVWIPSIPETYEIVSPLSLSGNLMLV